MKNGHKRYQKLIRLNARFGSFSEAGSGGCRVRFSSMNGLHWYAFAEARRATASAEARRAKEEGGRRKAEAIPIMFWTAATGFANGSRERAPADKLRDTHHLSMRAARRWVSQGLNPSYGLRLLSSGNGGLRFGEGYPASAATLE